MRVLQLIDTLDTGGAERMAVNYANALANTSNYSALISTRKSGGLSIFIDEKVDFLCLNKKNTFDFKAIFKLKNFILKNQIEVVHAHSSSFFLATICKIFSPNIKLIWHDHYGNSEFLKERPNVKIIKLCSFFFFGTIAVNEKLKSWNLKHLKNKNVIYLPNFISNNQDNIHYSNVTKLHGVDKKRIVCLANLRSQKNHLFLIRIAKEIYKSNPEWTFHLIGKDFNDEYSKIIKDNIIKENLENVVFIYGNKTDINNILSQCEIGILTSISEGLPVALLEYGLLKLAVVSTNVGEIPSVISDSSLGKLIGSNDLSTYSETLKNIINDDKKREKLKTNFHFHIMDNYEEKAIVGKYLDWIVKNIKIN